MPTLPHPELAEVSVAELRRRLDSGALTARRLAEMHLERIEAMNTHGPVLRAVIELNPDALEIASQVDADRDGSGPLRGIPVILKDNIDTGDRMLTTAGSLAMTGAPAPADAALVTRLRAAGLVILGKANLSEWANFRSSRSASGWSGRGRQCRNPHVLDRTPCGSSSGSAVAVAAGLAALAVGTETDGSITCPSSVTGVVGIKPTVGLISQRGIIPISASQDSAGPHGRTVADAAALLGALTEQPDDYTRHCDPEGLRGARLGVLRKPYCGYSEHSDRLYEAALDAMRAAGAELVDPVALAGTEEMRSSGAELVVMEHEFKAGLDAYLATRTGLAVHSLRELVEWNREHADQELPYFGQERFEAALATEGLEAEKYLAAASKARELSRAEGIDAVMDEHRLDALVAPTTAPAWVVDAINGDRVLGGSSQPSAMAGYPIISLPMGRVLDSLPVGLSIFGRAHSEAVLIRIAAGLEAALPKRTAPLYREHLELP
ncbi:MAG TPA: amidase [Candidatus Dormibacteraeota bacterium]